MRRLVAVKGELGEDHSECTSDQQLQPGVVEEDEPRSPHPQRGQQTSEFNGKRREGERSWTVRVEDPGDIKAVRPKASRILWTYGRSAGEIQIGVARPVECRRHRPRHHTPNSKSLTEVEHRQLDPSSRRPRFVAAGRIRAGSGRAITRLPALARFAPRSLVLDLADQVSTHLGEGMIKVALVGGGYEVRPSR